MAIPDKIQTWQMVQPTKRDRETGEVTPGKLEKTEIPVPALGAGEVLVEVAGCGVCHTDLGYFLMACRRFQNPLWHWVTKFPVPLLMETKNGWEKKSLSLP